MDKEINHSTAVFVRSGDIISFPKGAAYTIKELEQVVKSIKKEKLSDNSYQVGISIAFPKKALGKIKGIKRTSFKRKKK